MNISLIDLTKQYELLKEELHEAIEGVLRGGQFILGSNVRALEEEIACYTENKFGVGVANGTDALVLTLDALGIGPGDEVLTSPFTFFASAECISRVGARPVFVDIDPLTYCMNINQIEEKITERTKAIIPVHIFGQTVDMDPILAIAEKYGLYVIEDACQAIGASYKGKPAGSMGIAGCFSFFPTKNLGCYGDGGMVVTSDEELAGKIRLLRAHGSPKKYYHERLGYNSRLDEIQAAILRVKLRYLDKWNEARRQKAAVYTEAFKDLPVKTPYEAPYGRHVYHLYVMATSERDALSNYLKQKGIGCGIYYPLPLHLQPVYKELGYDKGDFPIAENLCEEALAIPLYPELEEEKQQYIIQTIREFFERG
jgi:dTDP-4-amino-4,6-dideoxygalactose transaminase